MKVQEGRKRVRSVGKDRRSWESGREGGKGRGALGETRAAGVLIICLVSGFLNMASVYAST